MRADRTRIETMEQGHWVWQPARARVVGFGEEEILAPAKPAPGGHSPWTELLATTVVGALAGWTIEEVATHIRGRRR